MFSQFSPGSHSHKEPSYGATPQFQDDELQRKTLLEYVAPYASEFIGTFLFVFTARVVCVIHSAGDEVWKPTALGFMFTVMLYIFSSVNVQGPANGAHLNPAISFAAGVAQKERWRKVGIYIILQSAAGVLAASLCSRVFSNQSASTAVGPQAMFEFSYAPGMIETVYTAILSFVALSVMYSRRNNPANDQNSFFGLAIGFVLIAGGYAGEGISGGCFNPAVAFALETTPFFLVRGWTFAYVGFEIFGGFLGACLFMMCRRREDRLDHDRLHNYEPDLPVKLASEFLGTFVLVFTVGICVVLKSSSTPWAAAAALMCMIYSLWDVSGAHFNPAVTFAVMLCRRGKCPIPRALAFMSVQLLAGLAASFIIADLHSKGPYPSDQFCLKPITNTETAQQHWTPVFFAELAFTFMLAFVVLAVATTTPEPSRTKQNFSFGLAIASCVTAGGFAAGSLSGGELNPAVSIGLQTSCYLAPGSIEPPNYWYWLHFAFFEMAGGLLAAIVFRVTHTHEFEFHKPITYHY